MVDLRQLAQTEPGNQCWVSPRGFAWSPPDWPAPEYAVPAERLNEALRAIIAAEPRIAWRAASEDGLRFDLVQRSRVFRFPDLIAVQIIPLGADRSTLAIFSRAKYGRRDYGVNRARVERWLAALDDRLGRVH